MWVYRFYENGQRRSREIGTVEKFKTVSEADRAAAGMRLSVNADKLDGRTVGFGALVEKYVGEELPERNDTAKNELTWINNYIRPKWQGCTLAQVAKPFPVEQWLKALKLAPKSKSHIRSVMSKMFACAIRWELMEVRENPMRYVRVENAGKKISDLLPSKIEKLGLRPVVRMILTVPQVQKVLDELQEPFRTMAVLAVCLGLSASELAGLQWADVNWDEGYLLPKRGIVMGEVDDLKTKARHQHMPLSDDLQVALLEHKRRVAILGSPWMFVSSQTKMPYTMNYVRQVYLEPAGRRAGLGEGLGWHSFRHTYSTLLRQMKVDVKVQQSLLRHSQMSTTMDIYTVAVDEERRKANGKLVAMVLPERARA